MSKFEQDQALADAITAYMKENKYASQTKIAKTFNVTRDKLFGLVNRGHLASLPRVLNTSQAGMIARKVSGWGDRFYLKGSPRRTEVTHGKL